MRRMQMLTVAVAVHAVCLLGSVSAGAQDRPAAASAITIIKAARLIDGRGGTPMAPAMVRVDGERIAAVGSTRRRAAGRACDRPRGGDADSRSHRSPYAPDGSAERALGRRAHEDHARARRVVGGTQRARHAEGGLHDGRDMGPTWPFVDVDLRDAINAGAVPGPRMMVAGNYVSSTGGAGDARHSRSMST